MATTQYIGARYVPVFADPIEWSNQKSYEPLTIVLHEGNSFTSKQYVPTGVDINDTKYWAETGNYNAQIEQYRRDTLDAIEKVTKAVDDIDFIQNEIKLISPYLQGTSVYVEHEGRKILMDCGDTTDVVRMSGFLNAQNVDRLDCVVITHFDHDHVGAFAAVAGFCDSDTDILIQMEPPEGTQNRTTYDNALTTVLEIVERNGLKTPRTPYEGEILTYDEIKLECHNTTTANRTLYESVPGESTSYANRKPTLNNYSIICIVDINNYVITYSGDIEAAAQRVNTQYMRKAALAFTPHHISGISGYLPWYMKQAPQQWLGTTAASVFGKDIYVNNRYLIKLLRYNYISDVVMTHNASLVIDIVNGAYNIVSGESLIASMAEDDVETVYTVFYQILPPSYETDNPFILYDITLRQLVAACSRAIVGKYTMNTVITGRSDMQVYKDIKTLMYGTSAIDDLAITITTGRYLEIEIHSSTTLFSRLIVYGTVDVENRTGYRLMDEQSTWKYIFDEPVSGPVSLADYLSNSQLASLFRSKRAYIVTSSNFFIPMFRVSSTSYSVPLTGAYSMAGNAIDANMNNIYRAWISTTGNVANVKRRNLNTDAIEDIQIKEIGVM